MGQPAAAERSRRPWLALFVLCLGTFAILLDTTIVNIALPSMITDLHERAATGGEDLSAGGMLSAP
jgi:predicted MFS family arabinose efflux permease